MGIIAYHIFWPSTDYILRLQELEDAYAAWSKSKKKAKAKTVIPDEEQDVEMDTGENKQVEDSSKKRSEGHRQRW